MDLLLRRRRWPLIEGRLIDRRHLKRVLVSSDSSSRLVSVDEYLVEFPGPDGEPARLAIKTNSARLPVRSLEIGQTVPLHVNRRCTKAVFGRFERRESRAEQKRREKMRLARDEARFEEKLRKPGPRASHDGGRRDDEAVPVAADATETRVLVDESSLPADHRRSRRDFRAVGTGSVLGAGDHSTFALEDEGMTDPVGDLPPE